MKAFEDLYGLSKVAMNTSDESPVKQQMIEMVEQEVYELLKETDRIMRNAFGEDWKDKVVAISSPLSSVAVEVVSDQVDIEKISEMTEELGDTFYGTLKVSAQVALVIGISIGLKSAGAWDGFKSRYQGES